jgi:hypothetical protein
VWKQGWWGERAARSHCVCRSSPQPLSVSWLFFLLSSVSCLACRVAFPNVLANTPPDRTYQSHPLLSRIFILLAFPSLLTALSLCWCCRCSFLQTCENRDGEMTSEGETKPMVEEGAPSKPAGVGLTIDPDMMLHSETLAHDRDHRMEHRVIEEVLDDVTELFRTGAATPSGKGAAKVAAERKRVISEMDSLVQAMDDKHVVLDMPVDATDDIDKITEHLLEAVQKQGGISADQVAAVKKSISAHAVGGKYYKPAMAHRLAVPLVYADIKTADAADEKDTIVAFSRLASATHVGEHDNEGIKFVFVIIAHEPDDAVPASPSNQTSEVKHVTTAEAMAFLMKEEQTYDDLFSAKSAKDVQLAIKSFMADHDELAQGNTFVVDKKKRNLTEEALEWIKEDVPFGGIKRDVKRRCCTKLKDPYIKDPDATNPEINVYARDWIDGCNTQSIAVVLFMFFACVAPAVAFGSLLDKGTGGTIGEYCKTHPSCTGDHCPCVGDIGVVEMLLSSGACGVVYAIIGGSPLTILGGTGPILVFTSILSRFAHSMEIEFLPFYAWTGVWVGVYSVILAATDFAVIIKYVTCVFLPVSLLAHARI